MQKLDEYKAVQEKIKPQIIILMKRLYVISFNCYSWYWLYREIFIRHITNFEDYLLWGFTTFGVYMFILEHEEIFFKKNNQ